MRVQIFVTLDLYPYRWHTDEGELWAILQPHVLSTDAVRWVCQSATCAEHDYRFLAGAAGGEDFKFACESDFIPVNFEDDANLSLDLLGAGDKPLLPKDKILLNRRSEAVRVVDASLFKRANVEDDPYPDEPPQAQETIPPGPFAKFYNANLRAFLKNLLSPPGTDIPLEKLCSDFDPVKSQDKLKQVSDFLKLAFWGGTRRRAPDAAFDPATMKLVELLRLSDTGPDRNKDVAAGIPQHQNVTVVNLHAMNGMMFRIGTKRDDPPYLNRVELINAFVRRSIGGDKPREETNQIAFPNVVTARNAFKTYFTSIAATLPHPASKVTPVIAEDVSRRVYVREHFVPFSHQESLKVQGKVWFRRRKEEYTAHSPADAPAGTTSGGQLRLSNARRFVVRAPERQPGEAPPPVAPPETLRWEAWDSFDVRLVPYRKFPVKKRDEKDPLDNPFMPLQVMPQEKDRRRFYAEMERSLRPGGAVLENAIFIKQNGEEFSFKDKDGKEVTSPDLNGQARKAFSPIGVGYYKFLWDKEEDEREKHPTGTVLVFGPLPEPQDVTILIPRLTASPIKTRLINDPKDLWGKRWEACFDPEVCDPPDELPKSSDFDFDLLACPDNPPDAKNLAPAISFKGDAEFEFAQSVTNLEAVIEVSYPDVRAMGANAAAAVPSPSPSPAATPAPTPGAAASPAPSPTPTPTPAATPAATPTPAPATVPCVPVNALDFTGEYLDDLINYNALKLYCTSPTEALVALNKWGQFLPVAHEGRSSVKLNRYMFRHRFLRAPRAGGAELLAEVPQFFKELYRSATNARGRGLFLQIEHTYGHRLTFGDCAKLINQRDIEMLDGQCQALSGSGLSSHLDFEPVSPAEVKKVPDAEELLVPSAVIQGQEINPGDWIDVVKAGSAGGRPIAQAVNREKKSEEVKTGGGGEKYILERVVGDEAGGIGRKIWIVRRRLDESDGTPFLSVEYKNGAAAGETLDLIFDLDFLQKVEDTGKTNAWAAHVAAWQSIVEMSGAESIDLRGRFLRFNFAQALERGGKVTIADGLVEVRNEGGRPEWGRSITAEIKAFCNELIKESPSAVKDLLDKDPTKRYRRISMPAPLLNGKKIVDACMIAEFHIEIIRPAAVLPGQPSVPEVGTAPWKLLRPLPSLEASGLQKTKPVAPADPVNKLFKPWLDRLRSKRRPIEPEANLKETAKRIANLIGDAGASRPVPEDSHEREWKAWIFPQGVMPAEWDSITPSVCPLSLLPLRRDPYLGDNTYLLLRRYLRALQRVLECNVLAWRDRDLAAWEKHFKQVNDSMPEIKKVVDKIADELLFPLPDKDKVSNQKVKEAVLELSKPSEASSAARAFRQWLFGQLILEPGVFSDSKAFLYTRLEHSDQRQSLTPDFFQLVSTKLIRFPSLPAASCDPNLSETAAAQLLENAIPTGDGIDDDKMTFRESLGRGLEHGPWFGFAEVLDDRRYDNQFQFSRFVLRSLENILEQMQSGSVSASRKPLEIAGRTLHLPDGVRKLPEGDGTQDGQLPTGNLGPYVRLASREPLLPPIYVFTGRVDECQNEATVSSALRPKTSSAEGTRLSLGELIKGRLRPETQGEPAVELLARSPIFTREKAPYFMTVTSLFWVRPDEEAETNEGDAFANDNFEIDLRPAPDDGEGSAADRKGESPDLSEFPEVFNGLTATPDIAQVEKINQGGFIDTILEKKLLDGVASALRPVQPAKDDGGARPRFTIEEGGGGSPFVFCMPEGEKLEAFLFKRVAAGEPGQPGDALQVRYLLMINVQTSVWDEVSVGIIQTRNQAFAKEFAQVSKRVSNRTPYRPVEFKDYSRELASRPLRPLNRDPLSVNSLVAAVFDHLEGGPLAQPLSQLHGEPWRRYDLSVTVYHRQATLIDAVYVGGDGQLVNCKFEQHTSAFPLLNRMVSAERPGRAAAGGWDTPVNWFGREPSAPLDLSEYDDFELSFQWSGDNNLQFFRLEGVRVHFGEEPKECVLRPEGLT